MSLLGSKCQLTVSFILRSMKIFNLLSMNKFSVLIAISNRFELKASDKGRRGTKTSGVCKFTERGGGVAVNV